MAIRHRKPNRLPQWRYNSSRAYFVTINIHDGGPHLFGEVVNGRMVLNKYGEIVEWQWRWLGQQYGNWLSLDAFVVMPNHIHGIIKINNDRRFVGTTPVPMVGTTLGLSLQKTQRRLPSRSLSKAICAFKTTSSKYIHQSGGADFQWQRSFHDRIVRDEHELHVIRRYIANNPRHWADNPNHR